MAQGASNDLASMVSAPVDGIAWLLRKAGLPIPQNALGGSQWMSEVGLTPAPRNALAGATGGVAGATLPFVAAARAPQVARGLLALEEQMPVASFANRAPARQDGIFAGHLAMTADKNALAQAQKMSAADVDPRTIWNDTGWFKGGDGKWRFEIDDSAAQYRAPDVMAQKVTAHNKELDAAFAASYLRHHMDKTGADIAQAKEHWREIFGVEPPAAAGSMAKGMPAEQLSDYYKRLEAVPAPSWNNLRADVGDVMDHPALFSAYPPTRGLMFESVHPSQLGPGVSGQHHGITISLRDDIARNPTKGRDVLLHEAQHDVQGLEGFAYGGMPETARTIMERAAKDEMSPLYTAKSRYNQVSSSLGDLRRADYLQKLKSLSTKPNPRPAEIHRMSAWYEHSTAIREQLGPMPKKAGEARDGWLRNAASILHHKEAAKIHGLEWDPRFKMSREELKKQIRPLEKDLFKLLPQARAASGVEQKFNALRSMSDDDLYRRLAGEAESRAVQARKDMTPEQRRATFPLDSYDVPLNELIYAGRRP